MFRFYVKLFIITFFAWNCQKSNNSTFNELWNEQYIAQNIFKIKTQRILTAYETLNSSPQQNLYSLSDMEDEYRQEKIDELLNYYKTYLNIYPDLNTNDKIIKLKDTSSQRERGNSVNGKDNVLQIDSYDEPDMSFEEVLDIDEADYHEDLEFLDNFYELDRNGNVEVYIKPDTVNEGIFNINNNIEDINDYKQKGIGFGDNFLESFKNFKRKYYKFFKYALLLTPLGLLLTSLTMSLSGPNHYITTGVVALAIIASLAQ
ncbi:hypothetical protein MKS88_000845 [Plasmodium brasilianum]|uniref:Uncharacterized protein n=1 Tax=Plasmodium brasilianum TaxID=5824 RepID=A0ACB9YG85_PLABR|nr:hypothetical protein MKS88_000845 [Plasmodium brasilianum]